MKQPVPIFEGDIVDSKLKISNRVREEMKRWYWTFTNGTHVDITIKKHGKTRTLPQNRYYFGTVIPILGEYFGYDTDEIHEALKNKFNPVESKIEPGKMIGGSTAKLSTEEFYSGETSYVERICRWAAQEFSIYVPPPEKIEEG